MKTDIILAGVGGQGILSIAGIIGAAALHNDLHVKQAEVHGMSQRGGAVYSHLRLSDMPIASDLIPAGKADLILSAEPMEALRYIHFLSADGYVITNTQPFVNINNYPDIEKIIMHLQLQPHHILIDADTIAKECGNIKSSNMVMLGAAVPVLDMKIEKIEKAVAQIFNRKGEEIVNINIRALRAGYDAAMNNK